MPPTYILSCELDVLKSEVLALAEVWIGHTRRHDLGYKRGLANTPNERCPSNPQRMEADNVDVEKRHFPRSSHGFFAFPTIGAGGEALESMLTFFNKHVGGGS